MTGACCLAYALRYFFTHHRMEKAQIRAAGEKLLESHQVEKVQKEQKEARRKRDRDQPQAQARGGSATGTAAGGSSHRPGEALRRAGVEQAGPRRP